MNGMSLRKYSLLITGRRNIKMIKTLAIACLAAVAIAEPEAKADATADPYLLYGGYGHHGHLGYAGYGHLGYAGYGRHLGYYGKRSADAEPEAKADAAADPYLLDGGYGHHGLGYAGYGHLGYAGYGGHLGCYGK
eukprot:GFUD01014443.1.p1 GENE.GFUD01014443.1~~GFUD01014443.1.p1  ORF type:complete len:135 (+),score=23.88 GFUD01014443.1:123-527(+)